MRYVLNANTVQSVKRNQKV